MDWPEDEGLLHGPLPEGWKRKTSRRNNARIFYHNTVTNTAVRTFPSKSAYNTQREPVFCCHILIKHKQCHHKLNGKGEKVTRTKEAAIELINKCYKDIQENVGEYKIGAFKNHAGKYSDCTTWNNHGDLGQIDRKTTEMKMENAVFGLEVGTFSGVIQTSLGLHLFYRYR